MNKLLIGAVALTVSTSSFAKLPTMKLDCGKVTGYQTEAERSYDGYIYNVMVTFIAKRPDDKLTDKVIRECIAVSLQLDDQKSVLATAWFRPIAGSDANDDEQLKPYGDLNYISYNAKSKKVEVKGMLDK